MTGVGVAYQVDVFCHMTDNGFWVFSTKLMASTVVALPVTCSKTEEDILLDGGEAIQ